MEIKMKQWVKVNCRPGRVKIDTPKHIQGSFGAQVKVSQIGSVLEFAHWGRNLWQSEAEIHLEAALNLHRS